MPKQGIRLVAQPGQEARLETWDWIFSPDENILFVMQADANAVLYRGGIARENAIWNLGVTEGSPRSSWFGLQPDGNLCVHDGEHPCCEFGNGRNPIGYYLDVTNEGVLKLYEGEPPPIPSERTPIWISPPKSGGGFVLCDFYCDIWSESQPAFKERHAMRAASLAATNIIVGNIRRRFIEEHGLADTDVRETVDVI
jgi:hypothetical protein